MRWLGYWAAVIAGSSTFGISGCLTSQENPGGGGRLEDPPISIERGGSGGGSQGGDAGEPSGGSRPTGGRSGAGGGSSGAGGGDSGCADDGDCASRIDNRSRCSVPTGECVDCLDSTDCRTNEQCVNNECRSVDTCATANDCPPDLVCNQGTNICVECVVSTDCGTDEVCVADACRTRCTTDSACALFGLRCDRGRGHCVECVDDGDCAESRNCQNGTCVRDVCVGGSGSCEGDFAITTCNAAGSVLSTPTSCPSRTSCVEDDGAASCEPWVCEPNQTGCALMEERVVECGANGIDHTVVDDCEAADQLCIGTVGGVCADVICEPNTLYCEGNTVQLCDSTGSMGTLQQTCGSNQFCDPMTAACTNLLCTPNQPACDGNVLTTCNAMGTGYTGTRTDCTMTDEFCAPSGCTSGSIDTIPESPVLYQSGTALSGYMMVNIYAVTSSRTLTRIEQYMSPVSATPLDWYVYEATTQTGTYTRISATMTTTSVNGPGYQASPDLAVPLVAGRFYAIGLSWTTPATGFGYQQTAPTGTVSFGSLVSAYLTTSTPPTSFVGPAPSTFWFGQRLTTAAPN